MPTFRHQHRHFQRAVQSNQLDQTAVRSRDHQIYHYYRTNRSINRPCRWSKEPRRWALKYRQQQRRRRQTANLHRGKPQRPASIIRIKWETHQHQLLRQQLNMVSPIRMSSSSTFYVALASTDLKDHLNRRLWVSACINSINHLSIELEFRPLLVGPNLTISARFQSEWTLSWINICVSDLLMCSFSIKPIRDSSLVLPKYRLLSWVVIRISLEALISKKYANNK